MLHLCLIVSQGIYSVCLLLSGPVWSDLFAGYFILIDLSGVFYFYFCLWVLDLLSVLPLFPSLPDPCEPNRLFVEDAEPSLCESRAFGSVLSFVSVTIPVPHESLDESSINTWLKPWCGALQGNNL